jgi:hypothetical protein
MRQRSSECIANLKGLFKSFIVSMISQWEQSRSRSAKEWPHGRISMRKRGGCGMGKSIKDLQCHCGEPNAYKGPSGSFWCEDCSGLVPAERILERDLMCKCETVPGTYTNDLSGALWCQKCSKKIRPGREIRSAYEIVADLQDQGKGSHRLCGPAAFRCEHCEALEFMPPNDDADSFAAGLKRMKNFICPRCRRVNKLQPTWEGMVD